MSEADPAPAPAATPQFKATQRWNMVWVVPIIALLVGGWLVYRSITSKGPLVSVTFETAESIVAGKTEVRCRSVRVGYVDDVLLSDDLKSVTVKLRIDPDTAKLVRKGSNFWVVKARVSSAEVSGLQTLLGGSYIEFDPGPFGNPAQNHFVGKERPPVTSLSVPGRRLTLSAERSGSVVQGSPVYFRGYEVGRIETRELAKDGSRIEYQVFIHQDYGWLVTENTRFWNTSGIDVTAGADGFKLRTPSFQAMVSGGVEFGVPEGLQPGKQIEDGRNFFLYKDYDAAAKSTFAPVMKLLLLFNQSVRGLSKGAPVEFRGIPIGRVADISFEYNPVQEDRRVPVLIEVDPSLLRAETREQIKDPNSTFLDEAVGRGLRASLKSASLLTGALFVDIDYHEEAPPAAMGMIAEYRTIPTVSSGLAQIEAKLSAILDKIDDLPIDQTMTKINNAADESAKTIAEARTTLKEIEGAAAALRETLEKPEFKDLPEDLKKTLASLEKTVASVGPEGAVQGDLLRSLDELRAALRSIKSMTNTIDEKPSSLLWGKENSGNPKPKAPKGR